MARQDTSRAQHHRLHHACGACGGAGSALLCSAMLCSTYRQVDEHIALYPTLHRLIAAYGTQHADQKKTHTPT